MASLLVHREGVKLLRDIGRTRNISKTVERGHLRAKAGWPFWAILRD